jgi:hypothetical protein
MAAISIKTIQFGQWGNAIQISNGVVEAVACIDFGPRIMRYGFVGRENMFFEDKEHNIVNKDDVFAPVGGGEWNIYGGHRLWTSPEVVPRTTYPDNQKVHWKQIENGIVLTPEPEKWNNLQKEIEISMSPVNGEITVIHRVTNVGAWPIEFSPWALSVMAAGGTAIVPQAKRQTGFLANRILSLWDYSKMNDERVYWGDKYILLKQQAAATSPFKFGSNNEAGWAAYYNYGQLFVKTYIHDMQASYPDYGVSFEAYTNSFFLELETLGQLKLVEPNEMVSHDEKWNLFENVDITISNEDVLDSEMNAFIKR